MSEHTHTKIAWKITTPTVYDKVYVFIYCGIDECDLIEIEELSVIDL